ncbi:MAG: AAA family ATPase [Chloroflexota bacterium]
MAIGTLEDVRQREGVGFAPYANSLEHLLAGLAYVDLRVRWAVARARASGLNPDDEFRGLYISEAQVDSLLGQETVAGLWPSGNGHGGPAAVQEGWGPLLAKARAEWQARTQAGRETGCPMLLDRLIHDFDLTPPEVDALLISLAPEIDPRYERLFAYLQDDITRKRPSVDLVLNLLTQSFQEKLWLRRLFTDEGPLIQSRLLIRFSDNSSRDPTLLAQYLRPARRVVEHLLGHPGLDSRLVNSTEVIPLAVTSPSPRLAAELVGRLLRAAAGQPFFSFLGGYGVGKREAALMIAQAAGQPLFVTDLAALASSPTGLDDGLPLLLREGRLWGATLYLTGWDAILNDERPPRRLFQQLLDYPHTVIVAGEVVWQPADSPRDRLVLRVEFDAPDYDGRLRVWQHYLGESQPQLELAAVANQFHFTPGQIEDVVATARDLAQWRGEALAEEHLFAASRAHSNQKLATLATKIAPRYQWPDIVLPSDTLQQLKEMVNTVRQRPVVYGQWGFERKLALGKGLNALFAGESGTGKTMAADIMAGELGLDLYKVDLSTLVSKYIGETEKNLNRIFTEAATSNAILFFDEADAIFGKRSEVKDSHDRYANIEISYLLQRMEAYDGVVILATNMRSNLDDAFTRRLHFIVEFPFPEATDRERIWRVNFPPETPLAAGVDFKLLAQRFRLAGGNIRNIILAAAFGAAEDGQMVSMPHLLHAARREYQKMGRLLDETLFAV